jgi:hypothetical protein
MSLYTIGMSDEELRVQACRMNDAYVPLAHIALALHRSVDEVRSLLGIKAEQAQMKFL